MATKIADYSFSDLANVSNQDGSYKAVVNGCALVSGPGATRMGNYTQAFRFTNGSVKCDVADTSVNSSRFTIKLMMKVNAKVTSRQNLAESTHLPFSLFLEKDPDGEDFIMQASVGTRAHDWSGVSTRFRKPMQKDRWYEVCMAYDTNTLGLFIDGILTGVWAFPDGAIEKKSGKLMIIGVWVDTVKYPFSGDIAAFQWMDDILPDYELPIDNARDDAPWHVAYKYESIKSRHYLGAETKTLRYDDLSTCHLQEYQNGWIMFNSTVGAFEIHGTILDSYKALSAEKQKELGWLVSDEINGKVNQSRKSLFKGGAIYWSPWTPATAVTGQMYLDYETLGEGKSPIGLPIQLPTGVTGGIFQKFQTGRMYYETEAPKAYEVHGAIFDCYERLGQYSSFLGWPISNESDIHKEQYSGREILRFCRRFSFRELRPVIRIPGQKGRMTFTCIYMCIVTGVRRFM